MTDNSEEARAFLQSRVALFWKVLFFIILLSSGLGALGAVAKPGLHLVLTLASTAQAGFFWWLCARGERTIWFSRATESGGLLLNAVIGAPLGRYFFAEFASDHAIASPEAVVMADGFVSMLQLAGMAMMLAIRAALIPSPPRRTILVTALFGVPMLVVTTSVVPVAGGGLAWRALGSSAYPWLPVTTSMIWSFAVITCTVISWVIYGLHAEVREARRLGQYVLERKLGEGGMGEVYRARHGMMRRPSAIKLLRGDQAGELGLRRFEREVQLTARLTHPNTITIFDYGRTLDGVFYYAMELLDGATLQQIVAVDGAQPAGRVVRILTMVCGALTEAHAIGLIHRDIKPANIMLCTQGGECDVVKLLDFGLVKELVVERQVELTGANTILGTPRYMAPESILEPDSVDVRTDIYSVGAVAYFLLAGVDVFDGKSIVEICSQHLHREPEALSQRGIAVSDELQAVVLACLAKDPDRRPQTAAELRRQLEECAVQPWSNARAHAWWQEHRSELDGGAAESTGPRTIAVDGSSRSSTEPAGRVRGRSEP
ncbi:MAG TPA: serine/threonine-protein kinase [Polyangiales bacterium]|nr:serine/threonine-protein kinase [Polyangiales bacterium]